MGHFINQTLVTLPPSNCKGVRGTQSSCAKEEDTDFWAVYLQVINSGREQSWRWHRNMVICKTESNSLKAFEVRKHTKGYQDWLFVCAFIRLWTGCHHFPQKCWSYFSKAFNLFFLCMFLKEKRIIKHVSEREKDSKIKANTAINWVYTKKWSDHINIL